MKSCFSFTVWPYLADKCSVREHRNYEGVDRVLELPQLSSSVGNHIEQRVDGRRELPKLVGVWQERGEQDINVPALTLQVSQPHKYMNIDTTVTGKRIGI